MRHITMALALAAVAMTGFLALPTAFHNVAHDEAALVTGGDCVGNGPLQNFCSQKNCGFCGQGITTQSPPQGIGSCFHSGNFQCPCGTTNYLGVANNCSSS